MHFFHGKEKIVATFSKYPLKYTFIFLLLKNKVMKNTNFIGLKESDCKMIAEKLNVLLANYSIFYQNTRGAHWNIKGNDFRLVVSVNFQQNACYVIWFGTHKEYDKINVETIAFDTKILN